MSFDFGSFGNGINPEKIWGDITNDDTFKGILGDTGSILKGITGTANQLIKNFGQVANNLAGLLSGNFIYIIIGGVVLVSGIYVYGEMNKRY